MENPKDLIMRQLLLTGEAAPVSPDVLKLLERRITPESQLPKMEFLFRMFGVPCFPRGELVAVAGKAKSGKTFFSSMLMAGCLARKVLALERHNDSADGEKPLRVMWYDTEQSEQSTQDILVNRILPLAKEHTETTDGSRYTENLMAFNVRALHWNRRMKLLVEGVAYIKPDLVVVDGVRDLVDDINNGVQAQETVEQLMCLASQCNCCIVCVLHQNKGAEDRNLRGWMGTELMNKVFEVYCCEKLMPDRIFSVEQTLTRKYDIGQLMYFRVDGCGLPVISEPPASSAAVRDAPSVSQSRGPLNRDYIIPRQDGFDVDLRRLFHEVLKNGPRYYNDLQAAAMSELNCRDSNFWNKQFLLAKDRGIIVNGRNSAGKSVWLLPVPQQPDIFADAGTCAGDASPF